MHDALKKSNRPSDPEPWCAKCYQQCRQYRYSAQGHESFKLVRVTLDPECDHYTLCKTAFGGNGYLPNMALTFANDPNCLFHTGTLTDDESMLYGSVVRDDT